MTDPSFVAVIVCKILVVAHIAVWGVHCPLSIQSFVPQNSRQHDPPEPGSFSGECGGGKL